MKYLSILLFFFLQLNSTFASQDCIAATQLCGGIYTETRGYASAGSILDEIPDGTTCLFDQDERGIIWYTFTTNGAGELAFLITPEDIGTDLDWALFDMTNASCDDLYENAAALLISCNAVGGGPDSNCNGATGMTPEGMYDLQGGGCDANPPSINAGNNPINASLMVEAGATFLLAVQNWTFAGTGILNSYTIDFTASSPSIGFQMPPFITGIETSTSICDNEPITLQFNQSISCSAINRLEARLIGENNQEYTATALTTDCLRAAAAVRELIIIPDFNDAKGGSYTLIIDDNEANRAALVSGCGVGMALPVQFEIDLEADSSLNVIIQNRTPNNNICEGDIILRASETFDFLGTSHSYTWTLPDGSTSIGRNIAATLPGTYKIDVLQNGAGPRPSCKRGYAEYTIEVSNLGESCNDGNQLTIDDQIQADCTCRGTIQNPTDLPFDCITAQNICAPIYHDSNQITTAGNIIDEIQDGATCLFGDSERGITWYTFTVSGAGELAFLITPEDSEADLDWALFDMTNASCHDLYDNAAALLLSCNAAGGGISCHGETGMTPEGIYDIQGAGCEGNPPSSANSPINASLMVEGGTTFLLAVQNWDIIGAGIPHNYTIDFSASSPSLGFGIPPAITNIEISTSICDGLPILQFNQPISCSAIDQLEVQLIGEDNEEYTATASSPYCHLGRTTVRELYLRSDFASAKGGAYTLIIDDNEANRIALVNSCGIGMTLPVQFEIDLPADSSLNITILNLTPDNNICDGETIQLEAYYIFDFFDNYTYLYTWTRPDGSTFVGSEIDATQSGIYKVEGIQYGADSIPTCNRGYAEYTIEGNQASISGSSQVCLGESTSLTATLEGGGAFSFHWSDNSSNQSISVGPGFYMVTITDSNGCESVASKTVNESPSPTITITAAAECLYPFETYFVGITTELGNTLTTAGNVGTISSNDGVFTISNIPVGLPITVITQNEEGCENVQSIIAPNCQCPQINAPQSNGNVSICEEESIPPLSVSASLRPDEEVRWYIAVTGGTPIVIGNNFTTTIQGTYYAEVHDTLTDCTSSRTAVSLTITDCDCPPPSLTIPSTPSCAGDSLTYAVRVNTAPENTLTTTAGIVVGSSGFLTVYNIPAGQDITLTVTTPDGCSRSQSISAPDCGGMEETCPNPNVSISGNLEVCEGERTVLTASGGVSYQWSNYAQSDKVGVLAGTYTVTVTDERDCETVLTAAVVEIDCIGNRVVASGQGVNTFSVLQVQPNPFKDETTIVFQQANDDWIEVVLYDVAGRMLYQQQTYHSVGTHQWKIDGSTLGENGIYFYRIQSTSESVVGKLILQR